MQQGSNRAEDAFGGDAIPLERAAVRLNPRDNVAIAKLALQRGLVLILDSEPGGGPAVTVHQPVPRGHKVALEPVGTREPVRRYGQIIGFATQPIAPGEHVHTHNLGYESYERFLQPDVRPVDLVPESERRTFLGYRRPDGRVGTRNYVAILSSVNCSAHVSRQIGQHFGPEQLAAFPNVDGVIALTHQSGCPISDPLLQRTVVGMARHPNIAASLLVGLGCETNQVSRLVQDYGLSPESCRPLVIQDLGGIAPTVRAGIATIEQFLPAVNGVRRTPQPVSGLMLALQCGGSDAWSGVTANPLLGLVADEIVRQGGAVLLAETPEIYGAEHLLASRAATPEIASRLSSLVRWWEEYARRVGLSLDDNRSAGNEAGGLTTIYEKSLGAVAKGGNTPLMGVYDYAEPVSTRGLAFMNSPGFDPVSVTGQVAGGCNLVLFSTGRGSVFGFKPAPSLKISTNSVTYQHMIGDMDFNGGRVLDGESLERLASELLDLIIAVASGQPTKSEAQGVGELEFCPWNAEGTL